MKRIFVGILVAALAVWLALALFARVSGRNIALNTAADLPAGTETMTVYAVNKMGLSGKYYIKAMVGVNSYTFKLAEDFSALAYEPGVAGAVYMLDYNSPADFYTQWYESFVLSEESGTVFEFMFEGDELVFLTDTTGYSPPDGPPMEGAQLPEGVVYVEEFELQSDPGDNMSAEGGAKALFSAILFEHADFYTPGDAVTIALTGLDTIDGGDAYLYTVTTADGESQHAVNYAGDVYVLLGGAYQFIYGGLGSIIPIDEERAMFIVERWMGAWLDEGMALVSKGEGEVNGQHAFLIDLGTNTDEKFTAERHYALTDDGGFWLLDVLSDTWGPAAAE